MRTRIGRVTNIYPSTGKVKVMYEDEGNASLPLSMLTMNQEYFMPAVGDMVVTIHMENGSSKGFVLGTYYGGGVQPKAQAGYRKDFGSAAYASCRNGAYLLAAAKVSLKGRDQLLASGEGAVVSLDRDAAVLGTKVVIGSAMVSEDEDSAEADPDVYLEITEEAADLKAITSISIEAEKITLKCSYGEVTLEELLKRLERVEEQLGLPHTV